MQVIKIGGNFNKDEVIHLVDRYFSNSKVSIQEENFNDRYEISFSLETIGNLDDNAFYKTMTNVAQDIILEIYLKPLIKNRVSKICVDYNLEDKKNLSLLTYETIINENFYVKEKNIINADILNYLMENNILYIDGFINFRLRRFMYVIDISIEKSIEKYEVEKEYSEFMRMLQHFVEIQEPKYDLINLIIKKDDYFLSDMDNNIIENGLLWYEADNEMYEEISKADLLVSSLIALSPIKLIVHISKKEEDQELIEVIKQVFKEKVTLCNGCSFCKINVKAKKEGN